MSGFPQPDAALIARVQALEVAPAPQSSGGNALGNRVTALETSNTSLAAIVTALATRTTSAEARIGSLEAFNIAHPGL